MVLHQRKEAKRLTRTVTVINSISGRTRTFQVDTIRDVNQIVSHYLRFEPDAKLYGDNKKMVIETKKLNGYS